MSELLFEYGNITHTRTCTADIAEFFRHITADTFYGTGLNDVTIAGTFTGHTPLTYIAKITTAAGTDKFDWSDDGGATWTEDVAMTGSPQTLSEGVTIDFTATTGHTLTDYWYFYAFCVPEANIATAVFTGSGLDDLTQSGTFIGGADMGIRIKVTTAAAADKFKWTKYPHDDNSWSDAITMTGAAQVITNGLIVTFTAATGHTVDEYWDISCTAAHGELRVNSITANITTAGGSGHYLTFEDSVTAVAFYNADVDAAGQMAAFTAEHNPVILKLGSDVTVNESAGTQVSDITISAYLRWH